MKSVQFEKFGKPVRTLRIVDVPIPVAGPGQVLIRMQARPINPSDLLQVRGMYGQLPELPSAAGCEGMGIVERLGEGVSDLVIGQRVIPIGAQGTWQEFLVADAALVVGVPDEVSDNTAAQFVVNPLTGWVMTTQVHRLERDEWLLMTAAGSTICRVIMQMAKVRGFKTIGLVRRKEQVDELKELGGGEIICTAKEDAATRVMEITGGQGVRAAIESVGGKVGSEVIHCLSPGGVVLVYGMLSGRNLDIDGTELIFRDLTVRGFWLSKWFEKNDDETIRNTAAELLELMRQGIVEPPVDAEFSLGDVFDGVRAAQRRRRTGKVMLIG